MKYKYVIFDLDGTLLDTLEDLKNACNYALTSYELPCITKEQTREYVGNGIRNLLVKASSNSIYMEQLFLKFKEYYQIHYNDKTLKYEGILEVLEYCKENGIKIGVLTNKVEDIARSLIEAHFPSLMDFVYGDVENRVRKPDPSFFLSLCKKYSFTKDEVLYIGDSEVDILFCNNAHIKGCFVSYGFRKKSCLLALTDSVVEKPIDLIKVIGGKQ